MTFFPFSECTMPSILPALGAMTTVLAPAASSAFFGTKSSASSNPSVAKMATRTFSSFFSAIGPTPPCPRPVPGDGNIWGASRNVLGGGGRGRLDLAGS